MKIELYLDGTLVKYLPLPDLEDIPGYTFQQNCEARERTLNLVIKDIQFTYYELFEKGRATLVLCFESKMHLVEEMREAV